MSKLFKDLKPLLQESDEILIKKFKELNSFASVANILEVSEHELYLMLFQYKHNNYVEVFIPKKNGTKRKIFVPNNNLSILQKKLKYILELKFVAHNSAHGFVKNKSIITNAQQHVNKKYIIKIDLENFFDNILYPRVANMFISYFKCKKDVAYTFANIVCHSDGHLPQGSPISPLISNIIAKTMDKQIVELCKSIGGIFYTRYADDLIFSTNRNSIPNAIVLFKENKYSVSKSLERIIEKNGFIINYNKFKVRSWKDRQIVTGIKVNNKLNVDKKYLRKIRTFLYLYEKNENIEDANIEFNKRYSKRYKFKNGEFHLNSNSLNVLKGMINFVSQVRGKRDRIFYKFAVRFNLICEKFNLENLKIVILRPLLEELNEKLLITGLNEKYPYTLNSGIDTVEFSINKSLILHLKNGKFIGFYNQFENFYKIFKGTKYYEFFSIPIYNSETFDLFYNSRIINVNAPKNIVEFMIDSYNMKKTNELTFETTETSIGPAIVSMLFNEEIRFFEGLISRSSLYKNKRFVFTPSKDEHIPEHPGFLFDFEGKLIGLLKKEDTILYVENIYS